MLAMMLVMSMLMVSMLMVSMLMALMMSLVMGVGGVMAVRLVGAGGAGAGEENEGRRHQRRGKPFNCHVISFHRGGFASDALPACRLSSWQFGRAKMSQLRDSGPQKE